MPPVLDQIRIVRNYVWDPNLLEWVPAEGSAAGGSEVSVTNFPATYPVTATDLDIRDLVFASDKVDATGSAVSVTGSVAVTGTFFQATQPVSVAATVQVDVTDEPARDLGKVDVASLDQYTPVSGRLPVDGSGVTQPISGTVTIQDGGNTITVDGTVTATPTGTYTTKEVRAATSAVTTVGDSATSVTLLASNDNRLGASVFNDSTGSLLYLKLGATASASSYTVRMTYFSHYEVPDGYTGVIDGIWDADAGGSARITELTA